MSNATKSAPTSIKTASAVAKRIGRPRIGAQPLTAAERSRRARERKRQARPAPPINEQMTGVTVEAILAELIASRGLVTALHKSIAFKVSKALVRDNARTAEAW